MKNEIDIHIIDDDQSTREALDWLLESVDFKIASYANAEAFLNKVDLQQTGCLVLDVRMPGISGMELLEKLSNQTTSLKTIILTGHGDIPMAVKAMSQGAFHFMQKPVNGEELVERVRAALVASQQQRELQLQLNVLKERYDQLTPREREVVTLVIEGNTNKVIASKLHIVERTVEVHRKHVMEEMEAGSLADLIQMIQTVRSQQDGDTIEES